MFRNAWAERLNADDKWLRIRINGWAALAIYLGFAFLIYWPVFLGHRFFWEDFFIQEYPIRDYSYYMLGLRHTLPFWNPYTWPWAALLADAQSGFWYPGNLLQIATCRIFFPAAAHLPSIVPETITILHLPLAALGVFFLLRKQFRVSDIAALLAGLTFGFGLRMVAEQNHPMQIYQLALLPWETLLLLRAWKSWRYAIALGLLFGISFLAGQPQTFYFIAIFFTCFTLAEIIARKKESCSNRNLILPLAWFSLAMTIAIGTASIQLWPSLELAAQSARSHLNYAEAGSAAIQLGHWINFFVPKFYGEHPGLTVPQSPTVNTAFWYWEATFYWSALAEILTLFAIVALWKQRTTGDPRTRYLTFTVAFSILALAFGMGPNLHLQWIFWKFVPLFDKLRSPNRMIWFLWFLGTIYSGFGIEILLKHRNSLYKYKRFFGWSCSIFIVFNLLATLGIFDLLFPPHNVRQGIWFLTLPSLIVSLLISVFFFFATRGKLSTWALLILVTALIAGDLYFWDSGWHRNTLARETITARDAANPSLIAFVRSHSTDHAKLYWPQQDPVRMEANLGMILRLPIEDVSDSEGLKGLNPMRVTRPLPPVSDSIRRMEIMGVAAIVKNSDQLIAYPHPLSFLKLYHHWTVVKSDSEAATIYNDSGFDFQSTIVLDQSPMIDTSNVSSTDTTILARFSENDLNITVRTSSPSILLVNDLYYPAWRASVDGRDTKILRGFTSLRAVPIPSGLHHIEMHYNDPAFAAGWKISIVTIALSLLALLIGRNKKDLE
jgi:hypothetical protein